MTIHGYKLAQFNAKSIKAGYELVNDIQIDYIKSTRLRSSATVMLDP